MTLQEIQIFCLIALLVAGFILYQHRKGGGKEGGHGGSSTAWLAFLALGVVYGDIGTSPLYTVVEINHHAQIQGQPWMVYGAFGLIFWSLIVLVTGTYTVLILKADNGGEGGTSALAGLLEKYASLKEEKDKNKWAWFLVNVALVLASCLLLADGSITPPISVLSAIEGLDVASDDKLYIEGLKLVIQRNLLAYSLLIFGAMGAMGILKKNKGLLRNAAGAAILSVLIFTIGKHLFNVNPAYHVAASKLTPDLAGETIKTITMNGVICLQIFTLLFGIQKMGTAAIGLPMAIVMVGWFGSIGGIGANYLHQHWAQFSVLEAINPVNAWMFATHEDWKHTATLLGAVTLCFTGGEALYADLGHFNKWAIRLAWGLVVLPALLLNYAAQAARLLSNEVIEGGNTFFGIVPSQLKLPMVAYAALATVIASQALLSGSSSLIRELSKQGRTPRVNAQHTSWHHEGQIYVHGVLWGLYVVCCVLVMKFQTSLKFASAYGLAVTSVMCITLIATITFGLMAWSRGWKIAVALAGPPILIVEILFFVANASKFMEGGYVTLLMGGTLFAAMTIWTLVRRTIIRPAYKRLETPTLEELFQRAVFGNRAVAVLTGRVITSLKDRTPPALAAACEAWDIVPRHVTFVTVVQDTAHPTVEGEGRLQVHNLSNGFGEDRKIVSVQLMVGYQQEPDLIELIKELKASGKIKFPTTRGMVLVGDERFVSHGRNPIRMMAIAAYRLMKWMEADIGTWVHAPEVQVRREEVVLVIDDKGPHIERNGSDAEE